MSWLDELLPGLHVFHCHTPVDRSGLNEFIHIIRSAHDPERSARPPNGGREDKQPHLTMRKRPVAAFAADLRRLFADGKPRTFNQACVELWDYTADMCMGKEPDRALWQLVEAGELEHTMEAPIRFRRAACDCG